TPGTGTAPGAGATPGADGADRRGGGSWTPEAARASILSVVSGTRRGRAEAAGRRASTGPEHHPGSAAEDHEQREQHHGERREPHTERPGSRPPGPSGSGDGHADRAPDPPRAADPDRRPDDREGGR
ncbi:hypothetical protein RKE29_16910, partial [Streptomyces sp. B1866]|nr:hypothetical protein [Streptomyces sp. B1866]